MMQMTELSNCSEAWYTCSDPSPPSGVFTHAGVKTVVADETSAKTNDSAGSFDALEWTRRDIQ